MSDLSDIAPDAKSESVGVSDTIDPAAFRGGNDAMATD